MWFVKAGSTSRVGPESGVAKGAQQVGVGSGGKQSVVSPSTPSTPGTCSTYSRLLHLLRPGGGLGWFVKARSSQSAQAGRGCVVTGRKITMEEIFTLPSH